MSSILAGQNYRWPIRASKSLSATFSEYRSGHLHAGIDIKTWGEMEVPLLAIEDGYIEHIIVGYNGYGRGLWLRLKDGNTAVYGHLEQFTPLLENLVHAQQLEQDKYSFHMKFSPDEYPVKAGTIIGYSGTSGTEHPHLHFEIRDTLRQVHNPQFYYSGIKDRKAPVLDEIMLIPHGDGSRINGSLFPVIFDTGEENQRVNCTGPIRVAINTHDRADGTYNKYNIFRAELLLNDSLLFQRQFDRVKLELTDDVDKVYPGAKGKRGWRFTSMYNADLNDPAPFSSGDMSGIIYPAGLSELQIKVSDFNDNLVAKRLILHRQVQASWTLSHENQYYVITRNFPPDGYENIQFYTGDNSHIPISETRYNSTSTSWVVRASGIASGVRALGSAGGSIKWVIPPLNQIIPELEYAWNWRSGGFVLQISSTEPYHFPMGYAVTNGNDEFIGELIQTSPTEVETGIIPIEFRALAQNVHLMLGQEVITSLPLNPMIAITGDDSLHFSIDQIHADLVARNSGDTPLYLSIDTTTATFDDEPVVGANINILHSGEDDFSGQLSFPNIVGDSEHAIFTPGKKAIWERLIPLDSSEQHSISFRKGGTFFLLLDNSPPIIRSQKSYARVRRGERLVFKIEDNTGVIDYPRSGIRAFIDGGVFFPDYNPLRHELSFHIPTRLGSGQHIFEFSLGDESGNIAKYKHQFIVIS